MRHVTNLMRNKINLIQNLGNWIYKYLIGSRLNLLDTYCRVPSAPWWSEGWSEGSSQREGSEVASAAGGERCPGRPARL